MKTYIAFACLLSLILGCKDQSPDQALTVQLKSTDTYKYETVSGDEEGARIVKQAQHFSISEVRRGAETNWTAVYYYQPQPGYMGPDYVELEILTGSDGTSTPTNIEVVGIHFLITY